MAKLDPPSLMQKMCVAAGMDPLASVNMERVAPWSGHHWAYVGRHPGFATEAVVSLDDFHAGKVSFSEVTNKIVKAMADAFPRRRAVGQA